MKEADGDNCGTGAGGFQPGNTCAAGGSGEASAAVRAWAEKKFGDPAKAKAFSEWFGASQIVDDKGEPLTLYHGTAGEFEEFESTLFFTDSPSVAEQYRMRAVAQDKLDLSEYDGEGVDELGLVGIQTVADEQGIDLNEGGSLMPVYVSADRVLDLRDDFGPNFDPEDDWDKLADLGMVDERWADLDEDAQYEVKDEYGGKALWVFLDAEGHDKLHKNYDAVMFHDVDMKGNPHLSYALFDSKRVKSAIANKGTFDFKSPKISEAGDNCGTGAGGFQPGNTCAAGGGGDVAPDFYGRRATVGSTPIRMLDTNEAKGAGASYEDLEGLIRNAADYDADTGELVGTHVTSNPDRPLDVIQNGGDIGSGRDAEVWGDIGPGLYMSAVPEMWTGRAPKKWDFADTLTDDQRQALGAALRTKLDGEGRPQVVYHGTRAGEFDEFNAKLRPKEQLGFGIHFAEDKDLAQKYATENVKEWAARTFSPEHAQNFVNWFGGSKIVDQAGAPLMVYHGTSTDFDEFSAPHGKAGFYFTSNPADAEFYAKINARYGGAARVVSAYLKMENDGTAKMQTLLARGTRTVDAEIQLKAEGFDGYRDSTGTMFVVFDSTQIKSTENKGTFNKRSAKITEAASPLVRADRHAATRDALVARASRDLAKRVRQEISAALTQAAPFFGDDGDEWSPERLRSEQTAGAIQAWRDRLHATLATLYVNAVRDARRRAWVNGARSVEIANGALGNVHEAFDPDQPRGADGRWTDSGGGVRVLSLKTRLPGGGVELHSLGLGTYSIKHAGKEIGRLDVKDEGSGDYLTNVRVDPEFQRYGIASAVYDAVEQDLGRKLRPSPTYQSPDAKAFWAKRTQQREAFDPNQPRDEGGKWTDGGGGQASEAVKSWAAGRFSDPTHAENFVKWFGGSKIVDENGEPLRVYHGTGGAFDEFNTIGGRDFGSHFGTPTQAATLNTYEGGLTVPVYLAIENPLRLPDLERWSYETMVPALSKLGIHVPKQPYEYVSAGIADNYQHQIKQQNTLIAKELNNAGYDGIVYRNEHEGSDNKDSYIAFNPTQIKSAIGNVGTFDPQSPKLSEAFDPTKHPHAPGGSPEGGQFISTGGEAGGATAAPIQRYAQTDAADRVVDEARARAVGAKRTPQQIEEGERAEANFLRTMPLVHGTEAASAVRMWQDGMKPASDIEGGHSGVPDRADGLDRFIFAYHGTGGGYGNVNVMIDNAALDDPGAFATPKDIIQYMTPDDYGSGDPKHGYPERTKQEYGQRMVRGQDYYRAASAQRAAAAATYRHAADDWTQRGSMEIKVPPQPQDRIVGFLVYDARTRDDLVTGGIPAARVRVVRGASDDPGGADRLTASQDLQARFGGAVKTVREADGDNCGTGAGGFQPGNTCGKGEGGGSGEAPNVEEMRARLEKSYAIGRRIRAGEQVPDAEIDALDPVAAQGLRALQREYPPGRKPWDAALETKPVTIMKRGGMFERIAGTIDDVFSHSDKDDDYYYHVTTVSSANAILSQKELAPHRGATMASGFYRQYSSGKLFFSERSGVRYWSERIEAHLDHEYDRAPKLTVLRFPKSAVTSPQVDEIGAKDSKAGSFFVTEPIHSRESLSEAAAPHTDATHARAVILEPDGTLWLYDADGERGPMLPGGHVEDGETSEEAVARECEEETGFSIAIDSWLIDVQDEFALRRYYLVHRTGGEPTETDGDGGAKVRMRRVTPDEAVTLVISAFDVAAIRQAVTAMQ